MNTEKQGNVPEKKIRAGNISATIWLNKGQTTKGETSEYRTISLERSYTDKEGKHFDFHLDEDRKEMVMNGIKTFFTNHPQGIITFG